MSKKAAHPPNPRFERFNWGHLIIFQQIQSPIAALLRESDQEERTRISALMTAKDWGEVFYACEDSMTAFTMLQKGREHFDLAVFKLLQGIHSTEFQALIVEVGAALGGTGGRVIHSVSEVENPGGSSK